MEQREKQQGTKKGRLIDDSDFVDQLRSNSDQAWAVLLAESWEPMRRMALRICGPQTPDTDIEDILQETLLAAFQNIDRFRGDSLFSTFLSGILRHKAADCSTTKRRRQLDYVEYEAMHSPAPARDPALRQAHRRRLVAQCLRELIAARQPGSPRRQALELISNSLAGTGNIPSVKEMARLWKCSPQRARWLWHDAKRILREHCRQVTGDDQYPENLRGIRAERRTSTRQAPRMHQASTAHARGNHRACTREALGKHLECTREARDKRSK